MRPPRALGVLLCYNDGDFLDDAIRHLLDNHHDVIAWDHGSTDETAAVLDTFRGDLREVRHVGRDVDFYDLYGLMSKHLLSNYVHLYDWISWPDQDEILEPPARGRSYYDFLVEVYESAYDWIDFRDFVFWFTERDDPSIVSPSRRIRHYCLAPKMPSKIRSWRASATNVRWFNHNAAKGLGYPALSNLRHYPMRSATQMRRRILEDRAGLQRGPVNHHYETMKRRLASIDIRAEDLHHDDGTSDLSHEVVFDWMTIYGSGPSLPARVWQSWGLSTQRWMMTELLANGLVKTRNDPGMSPSVRARIDAWVDALQGQTETVLVDLTGAEAMVVTEEVGRHWDGAAAGDTPDASNDVAYTTPAPDGPLRVVVAADAAKGDIRVTLARKARRRSLPLVAVVCEGRDDPARVAELTRGVVEFTGLVPGRCLLAFELPGRALTPLSPVRRMQAAARRGLMWARERLAPGAG